MKYLNDESIYFSSNSNHPQTKFDVPSRKGQDKNLIKMSIQRSTPKRMHADSTIESAAVLQTNESIELPFTRTSSKNVLNMERNTSTANIIEQLKRTYANLRPRSKSSEKREQDSAKLLPTTIGRPTSMNYSIELMRRTSGQATGQNQHLAETGFYNNLALKHVSDLLIDMKTREFEKKILRQILGPGKKGAKKNGFGMC